MQAAVRICFAFVLWRKSVFWPHRPHKLTEYTRNIECNPMKDINTLRRRLLRVYADFNIYSTRDAGQVAQPQCAAPPTITLPARRSSLFLQDPVETVIQQSKIMSVRC